MVNAKICFRWNDKSNTYYPWWGPLRLGEDGLWSGGGCRTIAGWLVNIIQYSVESVDIWIANFKDPYSNPIPPKMFGVDAAYWAMIEGIYVLIEFEYNSNDQILLTREQAIYILEQYRMFLEGRYKNPDNPPDPLDVEFIEEGQKAAERFIKLSSSSSGE